MSTATWGLPLGLLLVLAAGCEAPAPPPAAPKPPDDAGVIGTTVDQAIAALGLTLGEHAVIEEPPGIGRGVEGRDARGEEVWLYVERSEVEFTDQGVQAKLPLIRTLQVTGVARKTGRGWITAGSVIPYYHTR